MTEALMGYMLHAIGPVVVCRRYLNHFDIIVPVSVLNAFMIFEFGDTWLYETTSAVDTSCCFEFCSFANFALEQISSTYNFAKFE